MSDCKKIDRLLWQFPDISETEKDELNRHLKHCADCNAALETIKAIKDSSELDKKLIAEIDGLAFDAAVMKKIRERKLPGAVTEKGSDRYVLRLAFSFALAATVVLFLVKSISDLSEMKTPRTQSQKEEAERYGIINIELGKQPPKETAPPAPQSPMAATGPSKTFAESSEKKSPDNRTAQDKPLELLKPPEVIKDTNQILAQEQSPETTSTMGGQQQLASIPDTSGSPHNSIDLGPGVAAIKPESGQMPPLTMAKSLDANKDMYLKSGRSKSNLDISFPATASGAFSILPAPLATQAPDSININAIYVTSENVAPYQQTSAASIVEIYKDTGSVQTQMPQSSVLVTVDKMPQPLKMVLPEYPIWASKQGLSGTLWVRARVESDGHISNAEVTSCDIKGVGFEEAALKAAKESIFMPASANGMNLPVWIIYPVKFIYRN